MCDSNCCRLTMCGLVCLIAFSGIIAMIAVTTQPDKCYAGGVTDLLNSSASPVSYVLKQSYSNNRKFSVTETGDVFRQGYYKQWRYKWFTPDGEVVMYMKQKVISFGSEYNSDGCDSIAPKWRFDEKIWSFDKEFKIYHNDIQVAKSEKSKWRCNADVRIYDMSDVLVATLHRNCLNLLRTNWEITNNRRDIVPNYALSFLAVITTSEEESKKKKSSNS